MLKHKKLLSALLAAVMLFTVTGCGGTDDEAEDAGATSWEETANITATDETDEELYEQAIAEGSPYVVKADTLEDLAAKMGIKDVDAFLKTIETYNSVKGTDDPEPAFGVPNNQLSFVEEGPFYGVLMVSLNAGTMGGIQTQMTGEVLDVYGEVMPGLYACGEASNGAIYDRGYISGTSVLNCYVAGRDAGNSAAAYAQE